MEWKKKDREEKGTRNNTSRYLVPLHLYSDSNISVISHFPWTVLKLNWSTHRIVCADDVESTKWILDYGYGICEANNSPWFVPSTWPNPWPQKKLWCAGWLTNLFGNL